jgi:hypothetical protein
MRHAQSIVENRQVQTVILILKLHVNPALKIILCIGIAPCNDGITSILNQLS